MPGSRGGDPEAEQRATRSPGSLSEWALHADVRRAVERCRVVLLAATGVEAQPALRDFRRSRVVSHATKEIWVGEIPGERLPVSAVLGVTGCDKANAAQAVAAILENLTEPPVLVLQFGVAGAFPGSGLRVGDLAVVKDETYTDAGVALAGGRLSLRDVGLALAVADGVTFWECFPLDPELVGRAVDVLSAADWEEPRPAVTAVAGATSSLVTGSTEAAVETRGRLGVSVESMEGAAAAQVCALYGARFLEVRGISNLVIDRRRDTCRVDEAAELAARAAMTLCRNLDELVGS
jgi:futalosine hydrolase